MRRRRCALRGRCLGSSKRKTFMNTKKMLSVMGRGVRDRHMDRLKIKNRPKVLLLILDGWGFRQESRGNAVALAKTPVWDGLLQKYPHTLLEASGEAVGLPRGYMGNSEVGHLTIGAGRVVDSDFVRIEKAIKSGAFFKDKALLEAILHAKKNKTALHLLGLLSDSGVHAHIDHLFALLKMAKMYGLKEVYVHAILDGRDTPPKSAKKYVRMLFDEMKKLGVGQLATMMGRYYAMDRDNRWNREHKAYECMVQCIGRQENDAFEALDKAYSIGETDEFFEPTLLLNKCSVEEHDAVIFFNFRSDRARELTKAFVLGEFKQFKRKKLIDLKFVTLTQYDSRLKVPVAFAPIAPTMTLGEVVAREGLRQLRIAETEKWAHVTYFFNGLCECIFLHEHRVHIPSRKVKTYDRVPQMRAKDIVDVLLRDQKEYNFFVVNFANADMVGHTGNIGATRRAVEAIDIQLGRIVRGFKGVVCITADHGNCEDMLAECNTCHTTAPVPFVVITGKHLKLKKNGGLQDVAPTVLNVMGLQKPKEMSGKNLVVK